MNLRQSIDPSHRKYDTNIPFSANRVLQSTRENPVLVMHKNIIGDATLMTFIDLLLNLSQLDQEQGQFNKG
jgi:hypothetical protein